MTTDMIRCVPFLYANLTSPLRLPTLRSKLKSLSSFVKAAISTVSGGCRRNLIWTDGLEVALAP